MGSPIPITFEPSGAVAWVDRGTTVLEAARAAGVAMSAPCAGRGICGACGVKLIAGDLSAPGGLEREGLKRAPTGVRLACQARVESAVTVRPLVAIGPVASAADRRAVDESLVAGVDLGTTSVSAAVIGARTGREYGHATVGNAQASYGGDVLSRVQAAIEGQSAALERAAAESVHDALAAAAGDSAGRVARIVVAANPAMSALLAGADVASLSRHPFVAPATGGELADGSELRRLLPDADSIRFVPPVAGFVGGDALAGVIALGLAGAQDAALMIDIGTNAEVVLARRGTLTVASAAAGPAFEGGGVSCGGPAAPGAVTDVRVAEGRVDVSTIGGEPATWFSGAGIIASVRMLRELGHVDRDGLMHPEGPLEALFGRDADGVMGVELGAAGCLRVTQLDIRSIQLAKAAVCTALRMVLRSAEVVAGEVEALYVAGAFGAALPVETLAGLGIVPEELAGRTTVVGNAALMGASAIALDEGLLASAEEAARSATHVDLAADPDFARRLMESVALEPYRL